MRAANHLSGAERIVRAENIDEIVRGLLERAQGGKKVSQINVTIRRLLNVFRIRPIRYLTALNVLDNKWSLTCTAGAKPQPRILEEYAGVSGLARGEGANSSSAAGASPSRQNHARRNYHGRRER